MTCVSVYKKSLKAVLMFSKLSPIPQFICGSHDWFKSHLRKHLSGTAKEELKLPKISDRRRYCPSCDLTYSRFAALEEHIRDLRHETFLTMQKKFVEPGLGPNSIASQKSSQSLHENVHEILTTVLL